MKNSFVQKIKNDIYLSNDDIRILKKYDIDYEQFLSMKELLFQLENILNNNEDLEDLEALSLKLAEYNYHFKTKK